MRAIRFASLLCLALTAFACGGEAADDVGSVTDEGEALSAAYQGFTLDLSVAPKSGKFAFTGKTGTKPASAMAFVPDDEVGVTVLNTKGFTTTFTPREVTGFVEGQPMFVNVGYKAGTAVRSLVANAQIRASVTQRSGMAGLSPRAFFQAFEVGGQSMVRVRGATPATVTKVTGKIGTTTFTGVGSRKEWILDLPLATFLDAAAQKHALSMTVVAGSTTYKTGFQPQLTVTRLTLTEGDAYDLWPHPTCTAALKGCLASAGADTSACGDAWTVRFCPKGNGMTGYLDAAAEEISADYLRSYQRIHGTARGGLLQDAVVAKARTHAAELNGLADAAALAKAKAIVKPLFQEALAHPSRFIAPVANVPHDEANARAVAVDAIIAQIESIDLVHSEYGRSLEELVAQYPEDWIGQLESFRTSTGDSIVEVYGGSWVVEGRVLGSHSEVEVSQATGIAVRALFEMD